MKYDVFISYVEADSEWVETHLLTPLEEADINYYTEDDFAFGKPRIAQFEAAVENSRHTVLVLSKAYMKGESAFFISQLPPNYELYQTNRSVIPLILEPGIKLPLSLNALVKIKINVVRPNKWKNTLEHLIAQIKPAVEFQL